MNPSENDNIEIQLRRALRPVEPPAGFTERLMRALPAQRPLASVVTLNARPAAPRPTWQRLTMPAALAASLLVAVFVGQYVAYQRMQREQAAGMAASRELMQAMRVTSQKLDLAYQAVRTPPPAGTSEENRS